MTELGRLHGVTMDVRAAMREIRDPAQRESWHGDLDDLATLKAVLERAIAALR